MLFHPEAVNTLSLSKIALIALAFNYKDITIISRIRVNEHVVSSLPHHYQPIIRRAICICQYFITLVLPKEYQVMIDILSRRSGQEMINNILDFVLVFPLLDRQRGQFSSFHGSVYKYTMKAILIAFTT